MKMTTHEKRTLGFGVLAAAAIEESMQVLDDAGEDLEHTHAALYALLKQVTP